MGSDSALMKAPEDSESLKTIVSSSGVSMPLMSVGFFCPGSGAPSTIPK